MDVDAFGPAPISRQVSRAEARRAAKDARRSIPVTYKPKRVKGITWGDGLVPNDDEFGSLADIRRADVLEKELSA